MKKLFILLSLLSVTSLSALAADIASFEGDYRIAEGDTNCYQNLKVVPIKDGSCLSISMNNDDMDWSVTDKICNVNQPVSVSVEEIPSIMNVGTITISDFSLMEDTMITSADILYHATVQLTDYTNGATYRDSFESYMRMDSSSDMTYIFIRSKAVNGKVEKANRATCQYSLK